MQKRPKAEDGTVTTKLTYRQQQQNHISHINTRLPNKFTIQFRWHNDIEIKVCVIIDA